MKSIIPIIICIAMIVFLILVPFYHGELPTKTMTGLCVIICHICMWWSAIASIYDDDRIEKLERKIKELEKKNKRREQNGESK